MVSFFGDYDTTETVIIPFNTFSSDDPSASVTVTNLAAADVEIHKDGSTTQRSSDNGVTVSIDFDSITGNHIVSIDLSDNSDAGFYAAGSRYQVRIEGVTVDGATLNCWIGAFSIGCTLRPATAGRTLNVAATGECDADMVKISTDSTAADNLESACDGGSYNVGGGAVVAASVTAGVTLANGAHGGAAATFTLASMAINNSGGVGLSITGSTHGMTCTGGGAAGSGLVCLGAGSGHGLYALADATGYGIAATGGSTSGAGMYVAGTGGNSAGLSLNGFGSSPGLYSIGGDTGHGIQSMGGATSGDGIYAAGSTLGDGMTLVGVGASQYDLNADIQGNLSGSVGSLTGHTVQTADHTANIAAILADTNELQTDDVPGLIAALNNISAANVLTQVNAALDTAIAELGVAAPTATPTLRTGLMLLYMALRNKLVVQTSGTDAIEIYNDAGTKIAAKAITDDGADYTEAEMA